MTKVIIPNMPGYSTASSAMNFRGAYNTSMQPERMAGRVGLSTLSGDEVQFSGKSSQNPSRNRQVGVGKGASNGFMGSIQGALKQLVAR